MGDIAPRTAACALLAGIAIFGFVYGPSLLGLSPGGGEAWHLAGWTIAPLAAAAGCFRTGSASQGEDRKAWRDFGLGCVLWAAGTVAWHLDGRFPGLSDAGYMLSGLFAASGMFRYGLQKRSFSLLKLCELRQRRLRSRAALSCRAQ